MIVATVIQCDTSYVDFANGFGVDIANTTKHVYNSTVEYKCNEEGGYYLANNASSWVITCQADGTWSGNNATCIGKMYVCRERDGEMAVVTGRG